MLDIHIGVTREDLYEHASLSATLPWTSVHLVRGATNIYELRRIGYWLGTAPYVSYVDDDDTFSDLQSLEGIVPQHQAFFVNSNLRRYRATGDLPLLYPTGFTWEGLPSYTQGYVPHNPYFMKRDLAQAAVTKAYARILRSDDRFLKVADVAIAFEVQLAVGWTYVPHVGYNWNQQENSNSRVTQKEYREIAAFYLKLLRGQA